MPAKRSPRNWRDVLDRLPRLLTRAGVAPARWDGWHEWSDGNLQRLPGARLAPSRVSSGETWSRSRARNSATVWD